jgi:tetratricopeptide (TPR) repeat protein
MRESDTIEAARYLELFRAAAFIVTNISSTESPIPTEILAVRRSGDFKSLGIDPDFAGVFLAGLRHNMIVIRDVHGLQETTTIMHEYVHFMARNHGYLHYPMWFDEGFAEYLSAARIHFEKFEIGGFADSRRTSFIYLNWIPIRKILSPEDYQGWSDRRRAMFYAEAWALVHYLLNRPERGDSFGKDMGRYIELVESGKGDVEAFEEAFGITANDLNKEVKGYLERGRFMSYRFDLDELLPAFEPVVTRLSREQASLALAKIALRTGELDRAEHWFTIATADRPTRPQAEAGLGDVLKFRGEFAAAQPHFEKAVALAPDDPYCQLDLAEYWHDRARNPDEADERPEYLERARDHYLKAWKIDDTMPESYAMYGQTFVMEGRRYDKAIEMLEEAKNILPSNIDVRLMLAEAYMGGDRNEDAIEAARSVVAWSHEESDAAKRAREIISQLSLSTK